ncbi:MAG: vitamin K epoxide reductase family protein [Candidatus Uhrbacteria bacterium]|nr:vitamin K epoxide reductase family protein [Candidatus Uhrbacteria bacterium]
MIKPPHARFVMAIACLIGLFASAYLLYTYVTGAPIRCGIVSGCELVRASRWAYTFGIPRPLLGLVFYAALFGLLVIRAAIAWKPRLLHRLTMLAAVIGFIESAFLFFVQWLDIKAFCLWCLISAVSATVIALLAPFDQSEKTDVVSTNQELKKYFIALLIFLPLAFLGFVALLLK